MSAKGLILKVVGDMVMIETADPDELRREVNRALDLAALFAALRRTVREDTFGWSLAWIAHSLGRLSDAD